MEKGRLPKRTVIVAPQPPSTQSVAEEVETAEPESIAEDAGDAPDDPLGAIDDDPEPVESEVVDLQDSEVLFPISSTAKSAPSTGSTRVYRPESQSISSLPALTGPSGSSRSVPAIRARQSALDAFLSEMGKYPVLSSEEERELTLSYYENKDPGAARKLVVHNLRLVVKMAYRYRRAWANVLDLIQEGNVGLMEAVQRFDPFKGAKFSTYATFWIRAYMLRYLLENSRTVRISRTRVGRKLFFQLSRERAKLRAMGIEPGPKLLAEKLGVDPAELEDVVKHMDQAEVRLDAPIGDDGGVGTVLDTMHASTQSPEVEAFKSEFASAVSSALDTFALSLQDEREKMAWHKHMMAEDPMSLSELGAHFGVTKQRMGQIVTAMRKRLKKHLIQALGPDVELGFQFDEV
ncbi:MAG: sigma-70 family RNA polymerase sigma factor [Myxococcales bacterium]|nr:sigma-70 family RNA polymerase sigma factor [Myxococcales bacterium]